MTKASDVYGFGLGSISSAHQSSRCCRLEQIIAFKSYVYFVSLYIHLVQRSTHRGSILEGFMCLFCHYIYIQIAINLFLRERDLEPYTSAMRQVMWWPSAAQASTSLTWSCTNSNASATITARDRAIANFAITPRSLITWTFNFQNVREFLRATYPCRDILYNFCIPSQIAAFSLRTWCMMCSSGPNMVQPPKLCLISTSVMPTSELELDAADSALSFLVSFSRVLHVMCER